MADLNRTAEDDAPASDRLVSGPSGALIRRYDIGVESASLSRPFDIAWTVQTASHSRRFNVVGPRIASLVRRFDVVGPQTVALSRPFDVLGSGRAPELGISLPGPQVSTTLALPATAGSRVITLVDASGLVAGMTLRIGVGSENLTVESVSGNTVTLAEPLSASYDAGTPVSSLTAFVPGLAVFSKAGISLGVVTDYQLVDAPSRVIGRSGSMRFYVPANSPQVSLLDDDRLVAVSLSIGGDLWAGSMEVHDNGRGQVQVTVPDLTTLWTGVPVVLKQRFTEQPQAWAVYLMVLELLNEQKARDGEVEWEFEATGSKVYYGLLDIDRDGFEAFEGIATKSGTEFAWRARIEGNRLIPTLVVSDRFEAVGAPLFDGEGGNVINEPRWSRDASVIRNGLRLSGLARSLSEFLPEWAQWAASDVQPTAEVYVDPGKYRRRVERDLSVEFGVSDVVMRSLANAILAVLWQMYFAFIYAWHDQNGRPFHEGWRYEGPPSDYEPYLHTGLGWRTWLRLVHVRGQPASAVMLSRAESQVFAVTYNRVLGMRRGGKRVRRYWFNEAEGVLMVTKMSLHGYASIFLGSRGGVLVDRRPRRPFDRSSGFVTGYSMTMKWVQDDGTVSYHTVRRVISLFEDGAVAEGHYIEMIPPTGPTSGVYYDPPHNTDPVFTREPVGADPYMILTLVPAPNFVNEDPAYIGTVYDFEYPRIRDWDPRRDGVGVELNRRTVVDNAVSTKLRWHIVPFGVGVEGSTSLTTGIGPGDTKIYVDSTYSLPTLGSGWDGFAQLGHDVEYEGVVYGMEIVKVTHVFGNELTVVRGQQGSEPMIHEEGTPFRALDAEDRSIFDYLLQNIEWPEGQAWAEMLLARLSQPQTRVSLGISNENGEWSTVKYGSLHPVTLIEGLTGTARVLGYSPNPNTGHMELILEWQ